MAIQISINDHFEGKDERVRVIYERLLGSVREFGHVHEAPKKGSIHLDHKSGFAGVYLRKNYILLHFRTDYPIDSSRIQKQQQLSARRFKHTVRLDSGKQIDQELLSWLKDAYLLAG
ncbi:DUF5655 domain-containing protein [Candidatus Leptofilum sp.]|uniref:DUF5655 domain-containing protein n=1 Tax=Candidatus Leptofilum sp. TaxID=3241576 RepID=UPI003B59B9BB